MLIISVLAVPSLGYTQKEFPAFKMLIWEQVAIVDTTTLITEACNVDPSKDFLTESLGRKGPPGDRATWLASGHRQHWNRISFWVMAHSRLGLRLWYPNFSISHFK